jgi:hypothetical protein
MSYACEEARTASRSFDAVAAKAGGGGAGAGAGGGGGEGGVGIVRVGVAAGGLRPAVAGSGGAPEHAVAAVRRSAVGKESRRAIGRRAYTTG